MQFQVLPLCKVRLLSPVGARPGLQLNLGVKKGASKRKYPRSSRKSPGSAQGSRRKRHCSRRGKAHPSHHPPPLL